MAKRLAPTTARNRVEELIRDLTDGSQRDFAAMVGIGETTLSKLLGDDARYRFNADHLQKIEAATSVRLEWLERGELPKYWPGGSNGVPSRSERHEGRILGDWMQREGITQAELARRMEKAKSTVSKYFQSMTLDAENKAQILKVLGTDYDTVFGGSEVVAERRMGYRLRPVALASYTTVPVLRVPVSARAGFGYQAYFSDVATDQEYVPITEDRLYPGVKADLHVVVEVNGDSMEPILRPGFEVLAYKMRAGLFPKTGKIVMVDFRDELLIKKLSAVDYVAETIVLKSENGGEEMKIAMSEIRTVWHVYDYYKSRL